jgi:MATE family multidrug resistance protein
MMDKGLIKNNFTKYSPGSLGEISYISLPLMMSLLSNTIMILVDRIILAHYNIDTMNAVSTVINTISIFNCAFVSTAAIAEILVGRYNGQRNYKQTSSPVWQMIWLSIFSYTLYLPAVFIFNRQLIPEPVYSDAYPFYFWMMLCGPIFSSVAALSSFFIGIGRTYVVTLGSIAANLINIFLDFILIFGIEGYLDPMASEGAGIATTIAQIIFFIILLCFFLKNEYRSKYNTSNYKFDLKVFYQCLRIGLPSTFNGVLLIGGWAVIANYIAYAHPELMTTYNFGLTFYLFFMFYTDALCKGCTAIASNAIGAKKLNIISLMIKSAMKLHIIFLLILVLCTWIFPDQIISIFYGQHNQSPHLDIKELTLVLQSLALLFLFEGFMGIYSGILLGGGDTKFILITNTITTWLFTVLPAFICLHYFNFKASELYIYIFPFYCIVTYLMYLCRYKFGNWIDHKI